MRLLFELPLHGLPTHVLNLRKILLSSVGVSVSEENATITSVKSWISRRIPSIFIDPDASTDQELQNWDTAQLSQTVKSNIGRWLRQVIASRFKVCSANSSCQTEDNVRQKIGTDGKPTPNITLEQCQEVRSILEDMEDFAILADVLKIVSDSTDDLVLTALADTTNRHFDTLAAVGAVDDLFQTLWRQYQIVQSRKRVEKSFVESLIDLGERLPQALQTVRFLRKDLSQYEQTTSVAVCSPISDHMAEALLSAESTFADEIDQLLASGTSMDKQVLSQVFQTIIKRLELSWHGPMQSSVSFAELLVRLRSFGPKTFDLLITDWLQDMLCSASRPSLSIVLPPLVCTKSVTLDLVLAQTSTLLQSTRPSDRIVQVAVEVLDVLTLSELENPPPMAYRQYRFQIQQQRAIRVSNSSVISLFRAAIHACVGEGAVCTKAWNLITSARIRTLIHIVLSQHDESFSGISTAFDLGLSAEQVQIAVDGMVYPSGPPPSPLLGFGGQVSKILDTVCDFNLPLCQLRLRTAFGAAAMSSDNVAGAFMATLLRAAKTSNDACMLYWPTLVSGLAADQALPVREEAESELVVDVHREGDVDGADRKRLTSALVSVVEATAFSIADGATSLVVAQIADRLTALLASPQLSADQSGTKGVTPIKSKQALEHNYISLDILLRLLLIHQSTLQHPKFSQNTLSRLLITLSILLINPILSSHPSLPSHIFDTLAYLTDLQTEETRSRCIRTLRDQQRTKDTRLVFLFGYFESMENEWLQLVTNPTSTASESRATGAALGPAAMAATTVLQPFSIRRWEMMHDATPLVTENDTSLSLTLFGARKAVL